MECGLAKDRKMLSIAIPTWNRCKTLDKALECLLPQVLPYINLIEVIISDNNSEDDTMKIVKKYIERYKTIDIIYNRNIENLKFFGNFKKCRQLANGKFLWVLSDDDFVSKSLISKIICYLHDNSTNLIYLKNNALEEISAIHVQKNDLIHRENYRVGLISAVIFLNYKDEDEYLFAKFANSAFIAFIFALNSFRYSEQFVVILEGKCLYPANAKPVGYNFFDVFINHMQHAIDYLKEINIPSNSISRFRKVYLIRFLLPTYMEFRANNNIEFGEFHNPPVSQINLWLRNIYYDLAIYWFLVYPISISPSYMVRFYCGVKKIIKLIK